MKKNVLKTILSAAVAAAMSLSLCMAAFAAGTDAGPNLPEEGVKGSLTIVKYDVTAATQAGVNVSGINAPTGNADQAVESAMKGYEVEGVEFTYLRVGAVESYMDQDTLGLVYEVPDALASLLGLSDAMSADHILGGCSSGASHYTADQINTALKNKLSAGDTGVKAALEQYVSGGTKMSLTGKDGRTFAENLEQGLYLVVETAVPEQVSSTIAPFFVSIPMTSADGDRWIYDITVYPKNQSEIPTLDKLVSEEGDYADSATASMGDTLNFIIVSRLPKITSGATYLTEYSFADMLSKGMTYGNDAGIAVYSNAEAAKTNRLDQAVRILDAGDFTVKTADSEDGKQIHIALSQEGLHKMNTGYSEYYVVVYYTAVLNGDARTVIGDQGNPNTVTLTWKRTSDSFYNTLTDEVLVYTYSLNIQKNFSDGKGHAEKVRFVLYNKTDGYYISAHGEKGLYYIDGQVKASSDATALIPAEDGSLKIVGLEGDVYELTETATDAGYTLLTGSVEVAITSASMDVTESTAGMIGHNHGQEQPSSPMVKVTTSAKALVDHKETAMEASQGSVNAVVKLEIVNRPGLDLPQTGGSGLYKITILGMLLAAAGIYLSFGKRKEE